MIPEAENRNTPKIFKIGAMIIFILGLGVPSAISQISELRQTPADQIAEVKQDAGVPGVLSFSEDNPDLKRELTDHMATIFDFRGEVRILKKGSEEWLAAEKGMRVGEGDQVVTSPGAYAAISYDKFFLNTVRIEENTKAEFHTIEPTHVSMENGAIFNALDRLEAGSEYKISTPTAVAGVRGTRFAVLFGDEGMKVAVLNSRDGRPHAVEVETPDGESVVVDQDRQMNLVEGEHELTDVEPEISSEMESFLDTVEEFSQNVFSELETAGDKAEEGEDGSGTSEDEESMEKKADDAEPEDATEDEKAFGDPPDGENPGDLGVSADESLDEALSGSYEDPGEGISGAVDAFMEIGADPESEEAMTGETAAEIYEALGYEAPEAETGQEGFESGSEDPFAEEATDLESSESENSGDAGDFSYEEFVEQTLEETIAEETAEAIAEEAGLETSEIAEETLSDAAEAAQEESREAAEDNIAAEQTTVSDPTKDCTQSSAGCV